MQEYFLNLSEYEADIINKGGALDWTRRGTYLELNNISGLKEVTVLKEFTGASDNAFDSIVEHIIVEDCLIFEKLALIKCVNLKSITAGSFVAIYFNDKLLAINKNSIITIPTTAGNIDVEVIIEERSI